MARTHDEDKDDDNQDDSSPRADTATEEENK